MFSGDGVAGGRVQVWRGDALSRHPVFQGKGCTSHSCRYRTENESTALMKRWKSSPIESGSYRVGRVAGAAFVPAALSPPDLDARGPAALQEETNFALSRRFRATRVPPKSDLFVFIFLRCEAGSSSQIEGSEASLVDRLDCEAELERTERGVDPAEIATAQRAPDAGSSTNVKASSRVVGSSCTRSPAAHSSVRLL